MAKRKKLRVPKKRPLFYRLTKEQKGRIAAWSRAIKTGERKDWPAWMAARGKVQSGD